MDRGTLPEIRARRDAGDDTAPGMAAQLLPLSGEISPGIYQVRSGNESDRLLLAIV
jgi:hypothetical protein